MDYFTGCDAKPAISSQTVLNADLKPEELLTHIKHTRGIKINPIMHEKINRMYMKWVDLMFCGFNILVKGPGSKFALLETFVSNFLESGRLPGLGEDSFLTINPIVLNGLEPVDIENFHHAILNIKEKRRLTEKDYKKFIDVTKESKIHHVFIIHSYESLCKESPDTYDLILKLYFMNRTYVHLIMSCDYYYGAKKLGPIKYSARFLAFTAPYSDSYLEEKIMLSAFETVTDGPVHKLLDSMTDLQSLKEIYQALSTANELMVYIIEDYVKKSGLSNMKDDTNNGRKTRSRKIDNDLDFHDLFNHLQAKFILRRNTVLRQQLNELKDHNVIEYDETGNKIRCVVRLETCQKFLEFIQSKASDQN